MPVSKIIKEQEHKTHIFLKMGREQMRPETFLQVRTKFPGRDGGGQSASLYPLPLFSERPWERAIIKVSNKYEWLCRDNTL